MEREISQAKEIQDHLVSIFVSTAIVSIGLSHRNGIHNLDLQPR